ncbi:AAA family ATPase [Streptomyces sp. LaPpAH-108]|uniref:AAA family ATPase n=1 Tax=Streptomyces sp. LaPpAH-108 TaxID=1155714 RepID=UPI00036940C1|nr:TOPRIM nucleotidyl transferase/hydrolase domain-containing protein [Streptomyces sp. LaPpAH-108]
MKISRISASQFMSFSEIDLALDSGTTVVTGPNAVGKSNLGRIIDVARSVVASHAGSERRHRLDLYARAPQHGARRFRLVLDMEMDQPWERDLVATFVRAAYLSGITDLMSPISLERRDHDARERLVPESVQLLLRGSLVIDYDAGAQSHWRALWEHSTAGGPSESAGPAWFMHLRNGGPVVPDNGEGQVPHASLAQAWGRVYPDDQISTGTLGEEIDFMRILTENEYAINLSTRPATNNRPLLDSVRDIHMLLGQDAEGAHQRQIDFVHVLDHILERGIVLTDNRRLPLKRSFDLTALGRPADLEDGSQIPAELYRLKNGPLPLRQRYQLIQDRFKNLVGTGFDVQAVPDAGNSGHLLIDVTVPDGDHEYPLAFSGAGRQEALFLSTVLVGAPGRVIVLDEPGVHIEPTLQRRIAQAADAETQCLVITHSADLVPVATPEDLARIIRLSPTPTGSEAHRLNELDPKDQARWLQVLGPRDTRALLFAAGAVLCEGATEVGSLGTWWEGSGNPPSGANIAMIDVGGDKAFGGYIRFLEAFHIPWVVIADGPALHPGSQLHKNLTDLGLLTVAEPADEDPDFDEWKNFWEKHGVFTVADVFGTDGSQAGEYEAYLKRLNPQLLQQLRGERSKPRLGTSFADRHPMPEDIAALYTRIRERLTPTA